jgi:Flp pilus assembly protein TadG
MSRRGHSSRGQALIETAITLPVLFVLLLSFLLVMVVAQAYVDLDTATSLAAASAVTAPASNDASSHEFAIKTYDGTLKRSNFLEPGQLDGCGGYAAGGTVTCTGHATLFLSRTPMAILQPLNADWQVPIQATATGYSSPYRST